MDALKRPALNSSTAYCPKGRSPSTASCAVWISRGRTLQMAPAQATMIKNAITEVMKQPTMTSMREER